MDLLVEQLDKENQEDKDGPLSRSAIVLDASTEKDKEPPSPTLFAIQTPFDLVARPARSEYVRRQRDLVYRLVVGAADRSGCTSQTVVEVWAAEKYVGRAP